MYRGTGSPECGRARAGRASIAMKQNHKSIFTQREGTGLLHLLLQLPGVTCCLSKAQGKWEPCAKLEAPVAYRLILVQKVRILRALPNSKKIQAHWECGSLATMLFLLRCEVSYTVETTVNKGRDLTRKSPLATLSLWSWKGQPAVSPQARIY